MAAKAAFHRRIVTIASASALAMLASGAWAQSSPPAGGGVGAPPLSAQPAPRPPAPVANPLTQEDISKVKGAPVFGSDDKKIGTVSTVLMRPATKTIDRIVVGEGGVLGVGTHYVALPIDAFTWDSQAAAFKIAKTAEDLKAMPEWNEQVGEIPAPPSTAPTESPRSAPGGLSAPTAPTSPQQKMPVPPDADRT